MVEPQNTGIHQAGLISPELDKIQNIIASIVTDGQEVFVDDPGKLNKAAAARVRKALLQVDKLCTKYRAEIQQRVRGEWFEVDG